MPRIAFFCRTTQATGQSFAGSFDSRLKAKTGMDGQWIVSGTTMFTGIRRKAGPVFSIQVQAKGWWNSSDILGDSAYLIAAVNTTQNLNLSYGYLWWLNGKPSAMGKNGGSCSALFRSKN